MQIVSRWL